MNNFIIYSNKYLSIDIAAYYHVAYTRMGNPGNPDYLNALKNTYNTDPQYKLQAAAQELSRVLMEDLPLVLEYSGFKTMVVCVVPRAKAEGSYHANQLLFKSTVCNLIRNIDGFVDGRDYILRHTNTRTTHLKNPIPNYENDGPDPYPGITSETCQISDMTDGKNILLIDDIYTPSVNIDEDAIQALIDAGASSVIFYAVGKV